MKLKELVKKQHAKVKPETPINVVWNILCQKYVSLVPVVSQDGRLIGVVHEEDLLCRLVPDYREYFSEFLPEAPTFTDVEERFERDIYKSANDVLNKNVISVNIDQEPFKALSKMMIYHVKQLPVVDNDKYIGMLFQEDIINHLLKKHYKKIKTKAKKRITKRGSKSRN